MHCEQGESKWRLTQLLIIFKPLPSLVHCKSVFVHGSLTLWTKTFKVTGIRVAGVLMPHGLDPERCWVPASQSSGCSAAHRIGLLPSLVRSFTILPGKFCTFIGNFLSESESCALPQLKILNLESHFYLNYRLFTNVLVERNKLLSPHEQQESRNVLSGSPFWYAYLNIETSISPL